MSLSESYSVGQYWKVSVENNPAQPGAVSTLLVTGQHLVAAHPGEPAPNPYSFSFTIDLALGNFFNSAIPSGIQTAELEHGDHWDAWRAVVYPLNDGPWVAENEDRQQNHYMLRISGMHLVDVPEPHQFGLLAGLGLLGFGAYRRVRA